MTPRKVGVEEELMLVDPDTGLLTAVASRALRAHADRAGEAVDIDVGPAPVEEELFLQQIETQTPPRERLDDLGARPAAWAPGDQ